LYFGISDIPSNISAGVSILDIWDRKDMDIDLETKANKCNMSAQRVPLLAGVIQGDKKILCAPDDYSTKTRQIILNSFNYLSW
jgi:hypothetical protein